MKPMTERVISLRKSKMTYKQISQETGLSKGNISYLCNRYIEDNNEISSQNDTKARSIAMKDSKRSKALKDGHKRHYRLKRAEAKRKWDKKLEGVSIALCHYMAGFYDGEGNHKGTEFDISNSDPKLINLVTYFLDSIDARYRLDLYLHMTHVKSDCLEFWNLDFKAIRQYDSREQARDYSATENYGTVRLRVIKPLGLREALADFYPL